MKYLALFFLLFLPFQTFAANTHTAEFTNTANKYLTAADSTSLSITGNLTIQFAVNFDTGVTDTEGLITKYNAVGNRTFYIQRDADNKLTAGISSNGTALLNLTSATALTPGTWYCVVYKYVPSTSWTVFLDEGCNAAPVQDATITSSVPAAIHDSTANVDLGAYQAFRSSAANVYDGRLDDVRIWSENHDFSTDYNCIITGSETNLAAYWKLDDSLLDETTNNNDLTNVGSVTFSTVDFPYTADCSSGEPEATTTPATVLGGGGVISGGTVVR